MARRKSAVVNKNTTNNAKIPVKNVQKKPKVVKKQVTKISKAKTVSKPNGSRSKLEALPKTLKKLITTKGKGNKKMLEAISPKQPKNGLKNLSTLSQLASSGAFETLNRLEMVTVKVINESKKKPMPGKPIKYDMKGKGWQNLTDFANEVATMQLTKEIPAKIIIEPYRKNARAQPCGNDEVTQFQVNLSTEMNEEQALNEAQVPNEAQVQKVTETVKKKKGRRPKTEIKAVGGKVGNNKVPSQKVNEIKKRTRPACKRSKSETVTSIVEAPVNGTIKKAPRTRKRNNNTVSKTTPDPTTNEAESSTRVPTAPRVTRPRLKRNAKRNLNPEPEVLPAPIPLLRLPTIGSRTPSITSDNLEVSYSSRTPTPSMIVHIDGKVPTVPIVDCNKTYRAKRKPSPFTSSSSSSKSSSAPKDVKKTKTDDSTPKFTHKMELLRNLNSAMSMLDLEFLNWVGDLVGTDQKHTVIEEATYLALKDEVTSTSLCQNIRSLSNTTVSELSDKYSPQAEAPLENSEPNSDAGDLEVTEKQEVKDSGHHNEKEVKNSQLLSKEVETVRLKPKQDAPPWEGVANGNSTELFSDDEDAISLFADSLALGHSRSNSPEDSAENTIAEYESIPETNEPLERVTEKIVPPPPKLDAPSIKNRAEPINNNTKFIQNTQPITKATDEPAQPRPEPVKPQDYVSCENLEPRELMKSFPFKGVCFFFLSSNCKNICCRFPHSIPSLTHVKIKLAQLNDLYFAREYLLFRKYPQLMLRYFVCYIEECQKRKMTDLLFKMAIDSYDEAESVRTLILEAVLLCLNDKNLNDYKDQLLLPFRENQLCDELMLTIAFTQNFTRFKSVFVNLAEFIVSLDGKFRLSVATNIIERICILPYEETVSKALILILKNTDPLIFKNTFMIKYEAFLAERQNELYFDLMEYKSQVFHSSNEGSLVSEYGDGHMNGVNNEVADRRYNAQSAAGLNFAQPMAKNVEPTLITRTVDFGKPTRTYVVPSAASANYNGTAPSSDGGEELRRPMSMRPRMHRGGWRGHGPRPHMSRGPMHMNRFPSPRFRGRGGHEIYTPRPRSAFY